MGKGRTIVRGRPSHIKPGVLFLSSTNFTLLGLIIEKVTKKRAEDEIRRRIREPLMIMSTYLEGFPGSEDKEYKTEKIVGDRTTNRYHCAT